MKQQEPEQALLAHQTQVLRMAQELHLQQATTEEQAQYQALAQEQLELQAQPKRYLQATMATLVLHLGLLVLALLQELPQG